MSDMLVVPADVYDALEMSAYAYGGVGAGRWYLPDEMPYCIVGHAETAGIRLSYRWRIPDVLDVVHTAGNDAAVAAINARAGRDRNARVSWAEYCAERRIVRGEAAP